MCMHTYTHVYPHENVHKCTHRYIHTWTHNKRILNPGSAIDDVTGDLKSIFLILLSLLIYELGDSNI